MFDFLKPCPFCGGKAKVTYAEHGSNYCSNIYYSTKRGTVSCDRCKVSFPVHAKVKDVVKLWNRRMVNQDD